MDSCGKSQGSEVTSSSRRWQSLGQVASSRWPYESSACAKPDELERSRNCRPLSSFYYVFRSEEHAGLHLGSTRFRQVQPENRCSAPTVPLPPAGEQRAIAHILGTLDDKIELNRRMNETLEAMARALFKSWFVDFDPVRAKAERPRPRPPQTPRRPVPGFLRGLGAGRDSEGWEVRTLADFASMNPESWSKETRPDVINYVDLARTQSGGSIEAVTKSTRQHDAPSRAQRVLRSGDTIVGRGRPGNVPVPSSPGDGLTGSTGFAVLAASRTRVRTVRLPSGDGFGQH